MLATEITSGDFNTKGVSNVLLSFTFLLNLDKIISVIHNITHSQGSQVP